MTSLTSQLIPFGWFFVLTAVVFAVGLVPTLARSIYRGSPALGRRLTAPLIFSVLAAACFLGMALEALVVAALLGTAQVLISGGKHQPPSVVA